MPYHPAPPQGREAVLIFENLAVSDQHSAFSQHGWASPFWIVRLPATSPQQAKSALAGDPDFAARSRDSLLRGDHCATRHQRVATLCRLGLGLGLGLGHPRVTHGSRKGRPWEKLDKCFVCNKNSEMGVWAQPYR